MLILRIQNKRFSFFSEELKEQNILKLKRTTNNHMHNLDYRASSNPRLIQVPNLIEQNDGNNVNLDSQMSEQSKKKVLLMQSNHL